MIALWSLLIAFALLLMLLLIGLRGALSTEERDQPPSFQFDGQESAEICPPELVNRIFSREDWDFVLKMRSLGLQTLFRRERKAVAVSWVQQTASGIAEIMREHAAVARRSRDLEYGTEINLLWQYGQLMFICAALFVLIQIAGPVWLGSLAGYAQSLAVRIADAQRVFEMDVNTPAAATIR